MLAVSSGADTLSIFYRMLHESMVQHTIWFGVAWRRRWLLNDILTYHHVEGLMKTEIPARAIEDRKYKIPSYPLQLGDLRVSRLEDAPNPF